jgi:hypothetical protein
MPEELLHEREFTRTGSRPSAAARTTQNGHSKAASGAAAGSDVEMGVVSNTSPVQSRVGNGSLCKNMDMFPKLIADLSWPFFPR